MEFRKSDIEELSKTITITLGFVIILLQVAYFLQFFKIIDISERTSLGTLVLVVGGFILLMFDVMLLSKKDNRYFTAFDLIMLLSVISIIISTVFAQNIELAFAGFDLTEEGAFVYLSYVIIGYSAYLSSNEKNLRTIYYFVLIYGIIQAVTGLCQTVIVIPRLKEFSESFYITGRAFGTVGNSNPYGSVMGMLTSIEFGLLLVDKQIQKKVFHGILMLLYLWCVILSGTRGAMLGLIVSFVVILCVYRKMQKNKEISENNNATNKKMKLIVWACSIAIVALVFILCYSQISSTVARTIAEIKVGKLGEERVGFWKEAIKKTFEYNPFIGMGVSNFSCSWFDFSSASNFDDATFVMAYDAHNRYLGTLVNQGFLGLIVYLAVLVFTLKSTIKRIKGDDAVMRQYALVLLGVFVTYTIADFFCIGMFSMVPLFWLTLGLMAERKK